MKLKRLGKEAFARAADRTRLREKARAMVEAFLVDGGERVSVAKRFGVPVQNLDKAVSIIERAYREMGVPAADGVVRVSLDLPEPVALELWGLTEAVTSCADRNRVAQELAGVAMAVRKATKQINNVS